MVSEVDEVTPLDEERQFVLAHATGVSEDAEKKQHSYSPARDLPLSSGESSHTAAEQKQPPDVLRLEDNDDDRSAPKSVAAQAAPAKPRSMPRQQSLSRRSQTYPAASLPQEITEAINAFNQSTSPASPEIRDTSTPDIQSSEWRDSTRSPGDSVLNSSVVSTRTPQLNPGGRRMVSNTHPNGNRWTWIRSALTENSNAASPSQSTNAQQAKHPLVQAIQKRQEELQDTVQVNHEIKQALYDQWTPKREKIEIFDDLEDLEVYVKTNVQKIMKRATAFIKGSTEGRRRSSMIGGDLPVRSGWVESQRKGLFGSKTVRQHVQLCADGSFIMRKTEQPSSPVITNLHVRDMDIEADPDKELTINLKPHAISHIDSPAANARFRRTRRVVAMKVSDPTTLRAWLQAFAIRKRIAEQDAGTQQGVRSLVNQLTAKHHNRDGSTALSRAMTGLATGLTRSRLSSQADASIEYGSLSESLPSSTDGASPEPCLPNSPTPRIRSPVGTATERTA